MNQQMKACFKCGAVRPISDFPPNGKMHSGRDIRCIDCVREHREQFESACIEKFNRVALKKETRKRRYSKCKF